MGTLIRCLIIILFWQVFSWLNPGNLSAAGSLSVRYMVEDKPADETAMGFSSASSHIDNQAYLREFEERRSSRTSGRWASSTIVVVEKRSPGFSFPPRLRKHPRCGDNPSTFFEYQNGSGSLRYYDGYLPNRYHGPQTFITVKPPVRGSCVDP
jgi:hypothetical protein